MDMYGEVPQRGVPFANTQFTADNTFTWFDMSQFGHKHNKAHAKPIKKTTDPLVTGTSVLGVTYKDGVMIVADTLGSYGSLARFRDLKRIRQIGAYTLIGGSGEYSDFQEIDRLLQQLVNDDNLKDDGSHLSPEALHSWLSRVMYNRRNKFDPLWNQIMVAGFRDGRRFLGLCDLQGTSYKDNTLATGYGNYIARPLLRNGWKPDMTKEEAKKLLEDCMRVLFYRDARALNRIQLATISAAGAEISEPYQLETDWRIGEITYGSDIKVAAFDENNNRL